MSALAFPASPSVNDIFTSAGRSWRWTGTRWAVIAQPISPSRLTAEGAEIGDSLVFDGENYSPFPISAGGGSTSYLVQSAFATPYHYIGRAPLGTDTTDATWDISRIQVASDGSTTTLHATGAWSNRASLSYS